MFKKLVTVFCLAATVSLVSGTAMAETIKGRVGMTGRLGFLIPADNEAEFNSFRNNNTDLGVTGGVGIIYGLDNIWAAEFEVARSAFDSDTGEFGVTNLSLGAQYRFRLPDPHPRQLVPYAGAGLDLLVADYDPYDGSHRDVDATLGVHISGGADYFLTRDWSLNAEAKLVLAPDADISTGGRRSGDFDPNSFSSTAGIRYYFR